MNEINTVAKRCAGADLSSTVMLATWPICQIGEFIQCYDESPLVFEHIPIDGPSLTVEAEKMHEKDVLFTGTNEAKRYAESRPYFHPIAIQRAIKALEITAPFPIAVDVACGTGQSTAALTAITKQVVGFDVSWSMLAAAERNEDRLYVQAQAESMPFQSGSVPMLSTALAFHWFDRDRFFTEAWRVLSEDGLLLIYDNGFRGIMRENPAFAGWSSEKYPERFPTPPRDSHPLTKEEAELAGFTLLREESFENDVRFTPQELVAYLTTQTNVVAAAEQGIESLETANQWLFDQVRPFFTSTRATFVFRTRTWYLKKQDNGK